jgi:phosphoribosylformylglycinamidine synthase
MKVSIVQFPGSHGLEDAKRAAAAVFGADPAVVWHGSESVGNPDLLIVPGGTSFGDVLRPGALARASAIAPAIRRFARSGKTLGIGNGFQILCELGVLPGVFLPNRGIKFFSGTLPCTEHLGIGGTVSLPAACAWGRYFVDAKTRHELDSAGAILLEAGERTGPFEAGDIISVRNTARNAVGIIARPERALEGDGKRFLEAAVR